MKCGKKEFNEQRIKKQQGSHFRRGYYEINVEVDIEPNSYYEVNENGEVSFRLESQDESKYYRSDDFTDLYQYNCEKCGFIMSFTQKQLVESKLEEKKRKQKENAFDWSDFELGTLIFLSLKTPFLYY